MNIFIKIFWLAIYLIYPLQLYAETEKSENDDGSYFAMTRVTKNNIQMWSKFAERAEQERMKWWMYLSAIKGVNPRNELGKSELPSLGEYKNPEVLDLIANEKNPEEVLAKKFVVLNDSRDGIHNFKNGLKNFGFNLSDVWIAYLYSPDDPNNIDKRITMNEIEMAMTVLVKEGRR